MCPRQGRNGFLQIGADAERASPAAGQNDGPDAIVVLAALKARPRSSYIAKRQRIELVRPVDADRGDMPILGQIDRHLDRPTGS